MLHTCRRIFGSIVVLALLVFAIASQYNTPNIVDTESYVVQHGDTLWSIAKTSNGYGHMDTRDIIDDIQKLSDCSADIQYRQVVYVPTYEID